MQDGIELRDVVSWRDLIRSPKLLDVPQQIRRGKPQGRAVHLEQALVVIRRDNLTHLRIKHVSREVRRFHQVPRLPNATTQDGSSSQSKTSVSLTGRCPLQAGVIRKPFRPTRKPNACNDHGQYQRCPRPRIATGEKMPNPGQGSQQFSCASPEDARIEYNKHCAIRRPSLERPTQPVAQWPVHQPTPAHDQFLREIAPPPPVEAV